MRYLAIVFVLLSYPLLVQLLRTQKQHRHWAYFFLGMFPFVVHTWQLDAALYNLAGWPGYAKGVTITAEDTLALAILTTHRQPRGSLPLMGFVWLYIAAVALSLVNSPSPTISFCYVFQLLRFVVIAAAVAKIVGERRALMWLGMGLASGMIYEAFITLDQKLNGAFQAPGNMGHQNQLGMMAHFVILPLLGMLLSGYRGRVLMLGVAASLVVIVCGASRGAMGFAGLGVAILLVLSLRRRSTPYKKKMIGLAVVAMLVATPFLLHSFGNRARQQMEHSSGSTYDERAAFEKAAELMWKDHPWGVGANYYVIVANGQGYQERGGVTWGGGSRGTSVHNTYLLIAAETGWPGLITYGAMLVAIVFAGWRFAFAKLNDPRGDIVLGCTVAVAMMALHARYEWITLTYQVQYVMAISLGIIIGFLRLRALERQQARRSRAVQAVVGEPGAGQAIA